MARTRKIVLEDNPANPDRDNDPPTVAMTPVSDNVRPVSTQNIRLDDQTLDTSTANTSASAQGRHADDDDSAEVIPFDATLPPLKLRTRTGLLSNVRLTMPVHDHYRTLAYQSGGAYIDNAVIHAGWNHLYGAPFDDWSPHPLNRNMSNEFLPSIVLQCHHCRRHPSFPSQPRRLHRSGGPHWTASVLLYVPEHSGRVPSPNTRNISFWRFSFWRFTS
jgi:hypothetical protein